MLEIWGCSFSTSASYTQFFTVTATGAIHWNITMWPALGNKMKANRLLPLSDITSLEKMFTIDFFDTIHEIKKHLTMTKTNNNDNFFPIINKFM